MLSCNRFIEKKKDIRKFIISLENSIIEALKQFGINSKCEKNIGIWVKHKNETKKIAAIVLGLKNGLHIMDFSIT